MRPSDYYVYPLQLFYTIRCKLLGESTDEDSEPRCGIQRGSYRSVSNCQCAFTKAHQVVWNLEEKVCACKLDGHGDHGLRNMKICYIG